MSRVSIPPELLARYDVTAPRYTSYPPIPYWPPAQDGMRWLAEPLSAPDPSLSLYVHIPFCRSRCFYCGCYVIVSSRHEPAERYAGTLCREMELMRAGFAGEAPVRQFHIGGGTPTFVAMDVLAALVKKARALFPFDPGAEMGIEVDPRTVDAEKLSALRLLGFNRLSMGVQDFDPTVQRAVNRWQPFELVEALASAARREAFRSVNMDLIYGLPHQTAQSFAETLEKTRRLHPDRLALYHYAHLPDAMPHQRRLDAATLPDREQKLEIFMLARERLMDWGYVPIGLDHFALPEDDLAQAWREGTLQRNFMGYTTQAGSELLAFGVSAISDCKGAFWQNEKKLNRYEACVRSGQLPIVRGMLLDEDDRIRKEAIGGLFCRGQLDFAGLAARFAIDPRAYFAAEWDALAPLEADGLVEREVEGIRVTERGQFFLRNIAIVFDAYHRRQGEAARHFSRAV
jgi:oxygen-independent coproporphyrinogen-3 oxidase